MALLCQARFEEGRAMIEKAQQLDPLSSRGTRVKALLHYYRHQYDEAIVILQRNAPLDATSHEDQVMIGWNYTRQDRCDQAIAVLEKLPEGPFLPMKLGGLGEAYACAGRREEAQAALRELNALASTQYIPLRSFVHIYAGLGDWDRVFSDFEKSFEEHAPWLSTVMVDPRYDAIRNDPRFVDLLRRMGLQ